MVHRVTDAMQIGEMEKAFQRIFRSADTIDEPVQEWVPARAIFFPTSYYLDVPAFSAIVRATRSIGESQAYFTDIEGYRVRFPFSRFNHFTVSFKDATYETVLQELRSGGYIPMVESAFYSPNGTWGVVTSRFDHAIVAGSSLFVRSFGQSIDLDASVRGFLLSWKRRETAWQVDVSWVPPFMIHIYGEDRAIQYLTEAGFPGYT